MSKPLLIFDFDGTIADTMKVLVSIGNEIFAANDLPRIAESKFDQARGMSLTEGFKFFNIPIRKLPRLIASVKKRLHDSIDVLAPIPGMVELIEALYDSEMYEMMVLTSNSESNVHFFLRKYNIGHCFTAVEADVTLFGKARRMKRVVARYTGSTSRVVTIGDEVRDIEAAQKCGLSCIAVSWGFNSGDKLAMSNPSALVVEPSQLRSEIEKLIK